MTWFFRAIVVPAQYLLSKGLIYFDGEHLRTGLSCEGDTENGSWLQKAYNLSQRGTKLRQATLNRFELACAISPVALWKQQYHRVMPEGGLDSERLSLNS